MIRFVPVKVPAAVFPALVLFQTAFAVHPLYEIMSLRPGTGQDKWAPVGIGGMDWLPDGRMAVCSWGGNQDVNNKNPKREGHLYLLNGVAEAKSPDGVTVRELDLGRKLFECQGLRVVKGEIYLLEKDRITKVVDKGGDGSFRQLESSTFATGWKTDTTQWHHFSLNLIYDGKNFLFNTASAWPIRDESVERAATLKIPLASPDRFEILGGGIRNADGLGLGPEGELFASVSQGEYNPANSLVNMRKDRYFGMATTPLQYKPDWSMDPSSWKDNGPNVDPSMPDYPNKDWPVTVWLDYGETAANPSEPIFVRQGTYQGQMMVGCNSQVGGIRRVFLERIGGEYQGCVFYFIDGGFTTASYGANANEQGLEAGPNRLLWGPEGALYVGGIGGSRHLTIGGRVIGGSGNWNWKNTWTGLQRLTPKAAKIFEMMAIRSLPTGFEIEFSEPAGEGVADKANYGLQTYWHRRLKGYGQGHHEGKRKVEIRSVEASQDKRRVKVNLKPEDLIRRNEYRFDLSGIQSAAGQALFDGRAWYTLNRVGPADVLGCRDPGDKKYNSQAAYDDGLQCASVTSVSAFDPARSNPGLNIHRDRISVSLPGRHALRVMDMLGRLVYAVEGNGRSTYILPGGLEAGVYSVRLVGTGGTFVKKIALAP